MESTTIKPFDRLDFNAFKGVKPDVLYFFLKYGGKITNYQDFCKNEDDEKIKKLFFSLICERSSLYHICSAFYRVALMNFNYEQKNNTELYESYNKQFETFNSIFKDFSQKLTDHRKLLGTCYQTVFDGHEFELSKMREKIKRKKKSLKRKKRKLYNH